MKNTRLVAQVAFHAWGVDYAKGQVIPQDDPALAKWPEGTLANRLNGGSLRYEAVPEEPAAPPPPPPPPDLAAKTKAELVAWALDTHGAELDPAKKKDELLAECTALQQKSTA